MVATALIAVGVLTLLVFVLFTALLELFRDVRQIRDALGILDRPLSVNVGPVAGKAPSQFGLPVELDAAKSALVLFLSDKCQTCRVLASTLGGSLPAGVWIVVEAPTSRAAAEFLESFGLTARLKDRVLVDPSGEIAGKLGLNMTPVGYRVDNGIFREATTVPSFRYLASILPTPSDDPVAANAGGRLPISQFLFDGESFTLANWIRGLWQKPSAHEPS